ncbi:hypothetical protein V6N11_028359 [Hibiscus sabdariffa]|uniref:DNA topoisomerase (ATP-hydrolyzing) n=2 Tax=Hibiscus sabdariffa TaxID=183260 RepID=A0ABR2NQB7_9ROSI
MTKSFPQIGYTPSFTLLTQLFTWHFGYQFKIIFLLKSLEELILHQPDAFAGSTDCINERHWVLEDSEMVHREVNFVLGLLRIFDEILLNATDNKRRCTFMDSIMVTIEVSQKLISVRNNGGEIPIEEVDGGVFVPEFCFSQLLTGSNFAGDVKSTTSGRYDFGMKLTNIFSTEFSVKVTDGIRKKKHYAHELFARTKYKEAARATSKVVATFVECMEFEKS